MEYLNIMIVEDEALIAMNTRLLLECLGHTVAGIAKSGPMAIQLLEKMELPDFALVDVKLKGEMSGIEAAVLMRERFGMPFMFITGSTDPKTIEEALRVAPLGILHKPFDEDDFETALESASSQLKKRG